MTQISTVAPTDDTDDTGAPATPLATIAPPTLTAESSAAPNIDLIESYFQSNATWKWDLRIFSAYAESLDLKGPAVNRAWTKGLERIAHDALQDEKRQRKAISLLQSRRKVSFVGFVFRQYWVRTRRMPEWLWTHLDSLATRFVVLLPTSKSLLATSKPSCSLPEARSEVSRIIRRAACSAQRYLTLFVELRPLPRDTLRYS
jgi:hypothetical protein